jgi:dTDP-4-dehydrorhamnose reductase
MNTNKPVILVTGSNGQLGWEIRRLAVSFVQFNFIFVDRTEFDLVSEQIIDKLDQYHPAFIINCAAYTAVDKAEQEQELALAINSGAVEQMARWCNDNNVSLIQISTDYVFKGNGNKPYSPVDQTDPLNYYGFTKCKGEEAALKNCERTIIIRTSWVYSEHGKNFVKTMINLMKKKEQLSVVNDQQGSPTYAADLAHAILQIIQKLIAGTKHYGIYHYTNNGNITWYEFARAIKELTSATCNIIPVSSDQYPTPAKRPAYSVLDTNKIENDYAVKMVDWRTSLQTCIKRILSAE